MKKYLILIILFFTFSSCEEDLEEVEPDFNPLKQELTVEGVNNANNTSDYQIVYTSGYLNRTLNLNRIINRENVFFYEPNNKAFFIDLDGIQINGDTSITLDFFYATQEIDKDKIINIVNGIEVSIFGDDGSSRIYESDILLYTAHPTFKKFKIEIFETHHVKGKIELNYKIGTEFYTDFIVFDIENNLSELVDSEFFDL